jgi:hypothetical protein
MAKSDPPFDVELSIAGAAPIHLKMHPDAIRAIAERNPIIGSSMDPAKDERDRVRNAGYRIVTRWLDPKTRADPLHISEGGTVWVIQGAAIMAVRFSDPTIPEGSRQVGFVPPAGAGPG